MLLIVPCDRCKKSTAGTLEKVNNVITTTGFFWMNADDMQRYKRTPLEQYVCQACMEQDPLYQRKRPVEAM